MTSSYRIAVWGDDHLGYAARCRIHPASGLNHRVRDGYLALRERVTQAIEAQVHLVLQTGDLFHRSWPAVSDIVWARQQFDRLAQAGIPVVGNTGNHDASSERGKSPATAAVHDPDRGVDFVLEPYRVLHPVDGLAVHMVSHYGLAQAERLLPEPTPGAVNVLSAHGAAMVPGHEVFRCTDSPGEQPIGLDLLADPRWAVTALGHYHGMDEILPRVWYAGSAVRRGFADPPGGRGWLLLDIQPDGSVQVQPQYITQRPQFDLPVIDAAGWTGAQVEEAIRAHLAQVDLTDAIVRQVVTNCAASVRRGVDQPALARVAAPALMWLPEFRRPEPAAASAGGSGGDTVGDSLVTAGSADLPRAWNTWATSWLARVEAAPALHPTVVAEGHRHLVAASTAVDGGEFAAPVPAPTGEDQAA